MSPHTDYIQTLVKRGGPQPEDYPILDTWICQLYAGLDSGDIPSEVISHLHSAFSAILSPSTMHGFAYTKPYGYAGDFEIIDRHYLTKISDDPHLASWDRYWHAGAAACAVRNRKKYFHDLLLDHLCAAEGQRVNVLNVASGPARDVLEFLSSGTRNVHFDCIEQDNRAIAYATNLCCNFSEQVSFIQADVLRFTPSKSYDLIWAAGLFDYFSDRVFTRALKRLLPSVAPTGEIVVGNFSVANPNIHWLRFCDWHLNHRSPEQLIELASTAGAHPDHIRVRQEPAGVNLFLHITKEKEG